jgi:hypothetical protein
MSHFCSLTNSWKLKRLFGAGLSTLTPINIIVSDVLKFIINYLNAVCCLGFPKDKSHTVVSLGTFLATICDLAVSLQIPCLKYEWKNWQCLLQHCLA